MKDFLIAILLVASLSLSCQTPQKTAAKRQPLPDCEWCGAMDAPQELDWQTRIAPEDEPGEPIYISGVIYLSDSVTPAEGILVYAYHTNQKGIYDKKGDESGNGRRHGYLRSWMRSDARGRYAFRSIKPAPYPNRPEPAHVHITLSSDEIEEYWIESTLFEGDPLISETSIAEEADKGLFSAIVRLEKNEEGVWEGRRNIILKK